MSGLILGLGYTGKTLKRRLEEEGEEVVTTTRQSGEGDLDFDLEDEKTWQDLPDVDFTYWLFAPKNKTQTQLFLKRHGNRLGKIVEVSSTGFLLAEEEDGVVNEKSRLDLSKERVQAEEALRTFGAVIVHASGIYGPGRDPRRWVESGRVPYSDKFLNSIHVQDLVQFVMSAMSRGEEKSRYIASDNQPHRWKTLIDEWKLPKNDGESSRPSKKVNSSASIAALEVELTYPSILEGVKSCS